MAFAAADTALRAGDIRAAIDAYSHALRIAPERAGGWFNLAWAQRTDRRFDEAIASYAEAIRCGIDRPEEAMLNRASILSDYLSRPGEAIDELCAALRIDPLFVTAWLNLATIHEDLGAADEARAAYREALRIDPANGRAHARIGVIDTFAGRAGEAVADLRGALDGARSLDDRAEILFALGGALDSIADHADAFHAIEAANVHARAAAAVRYDRAQVEGLVDALIATRWEHEVGAARPDDAPTPIFICGMFRSGSTLAERVIARHSLVVAGGEIDFVPSLVARLSPYPDSVARLADNAKAALRREYLDELPRAPFVTDKRCDNFLHIGLIKTLFPAARIVHTRRDALDNILSVYFLNFGEGIPYSTALEDIVHFYLQYRRLMEHWKTLFPADIHDLDYDLLVDRPGDAIGEALRFLGLPDEPVAGRAMESGGAIRTGSVWQARGAIHTRSSGRSHVYAAQLDGVRRMLAAAGA